MADPGQSFTFVMYAWLFERATSRRAKINAVSQALTLSDIDEIIDSYKDGWNGPNGKFARVVARMLSQLE